MKLKARGGELGKASNKNYILSRLYDIECELKSEKEKYFSWIFLYHKLRYSQCAHSSYVSILEHVQGRKLFVEF